MFLRFCPIPNYSPSRHSSRDCRVNSYHNMLPPSKFDFIGIFFACQPFAYQKVWAESPLIFYSKAL